MRQQALSLKPGEVRLTSLTAEDHLGFVSHAKEPMPTPISQLKPVGELDKHQLPSALGT